MASNNWQSTIFSLFVRDISISLIQMCNLLCYTLKSELRGLLTSIKVKGELKKIKKLEILFFFEKLDILLTGIRFYLKEESFGLEKF